MGSLAKRIVVRWVQAAIATSMMFVSWMWARSPVLATALIIFAPPVIAATPFLAFGFRMFELALLSLFALWIAAIVWRFR